MSLCLFPFLLYRGLSREKYRLGLRQRLGLYPKEVLHKLSGKPLIWIQAVSVGEVLAVIPLISEIRKRFSGYQLLISTTTLTGHRICVEKVASEDIVIFFPLDYYWTIRRSLRRFKPALIALVETEIWPNFICIAKRMSIPVVLINGRISPGSFRGYIRFRRLMKKVLSGFSWLGMQTQEDAERVIALGADPENVGVTPSLKYEGAIKLAEKNYDKSAIRKELRLTEKAALITAGSTHNGEEEALTQVYLELKNEFPNLALILAPRHPHRVPKIAAYLRSKNVPFNLRSDLCRDNVSFKSVIIIDTLGELIKYYSISAIVFIGKSLYEKGGQNPIEPAVFSKPVIFGPHMENFQEASELLLKNNGAFMVNNPAELAHRLRHLLLNPDEARGMGQRAHSVILSKKGAVEKTIRFMEKVLTCN